MDPASLAAALVAAQMSRMQTAVAAKMMRMNADQGASIAQLLQSAQENAAKLANVAAGVGQNVDISA
ncbi:MAG TPA: hypothetical protein VFX37_14625 [Pseudolabrys sp.]|nr:hypothetical protein [Pseudolabrys sp.]